MHERGSRGATGTGYRQEPLGGGRTRFIVSPAPLPVRGADAWASGGPAGLLALALLNRDGSPASVMLSLLSAILVAWLVFRMSRRYRLRRLEQRRSPGGCFIASAGGLELPSGTRIGRDQLQRLVLRNGLVPDEGGAHPGSDALRVSYQLCVDHENHRTTLAGGMTQKTAMGILSDAGEVLRLS